MRGKKRHNYINLKIWKLGLEIAKNVSDILVNFPKHEVYDLSSRLSRCSLPMPSNFAEGSSRTEKSFSHFLDVSLGSSYELDTPLLGAKHRNYTTRTREARKEE
ncbi:four helix bundle protein [Salinimicrobium sp. GXAS 041]|uniref:four helix bundle protein n=1 Tax=Salinimicrobium sp. GXAS 041 TaxID=3400806 RepID=UPI003C751359